MTKERRIDERFFLNLQARVSARFTDDAPEVFIDTVAANISSSGVFIKTSPPLPMASKVRIEFQISYDDLKKLRFILSVKSLRKFTAEHVWVQATGVVIRQDKDGVALMFDKNYQLCPMQPAER